ncbi:hypothetical protein [Saliphagus sp. LR7]|uniref:DUF5789 family protein n=1 Tax=Saliphagus sp. LR7 TaxID=2282654 RepID=UPI000DF75C9E|nr:hypothetical protein [Saliphagus sp. LR7]
MQIEDLPEHFDEQLTYPADRATVIEQLGEVEVEAPDQGDSETVSTILRPLTDETYDSPDELYTTIIGNLNEEYIGRKFYDDRGQQTIDTSERSEDERDISF